MNWKMVIFIMLFPLLLKSQENNVLPYSHITLDSVVISAVKKGLSIEDLIKVMQFDSTLYIAYNNLHFTDYQYIHDLSVLDKKGKTDAWKKEIVSQVYQDKCRKQNIDSFYVDGDFVNRKGNDKYYTVELFDNTLYSEKPICGEKRKTNWNEDVYGSKLEGHLGSVKRVIFNPGTPVDLPLIGKKFAIFEPQMQEFYNYSIERKMVEGEECFVFTVLAKPDYEDSRKEIIVRKLITAFRRSDFQIIQRDYHMEYQGALVKLDIAMDMKLKAVNDKFYPSQISYDGFFKVPTKKAERIQFVTDFKY